MRIPIRWAAAGAMVVAMAAAASYFFLTDSPRAPRATFSLLSGRTLSTRQLRGKVYVVDFWATSCATCIAEMPQMIQTYQRFRGQQFEFIAVAMSYDPAGYVADYSRTRHLPFQVALDTSGQVAKAFYDVRMTPTTFLVDKRGHVVKRILGRPDFGTLDALIRDELARPA